MTSTFSSAPFMTWYGHDCQSPSTTVQVHFQLRLHPRACGYVFEALKRSVTFSSPSTIVMSRRRVLASSSSRKSHIMPTTMAW